MAGGNCLVSSDYVGVVFYLCLVLNSHREAVEIRVGIVKFHSMLDDLLVPFAPKGCWQVVSYLMATGKIENLATHICTYIIKPWGLSGSLSLNEAVRWSLSTNAFVISAELPKRLSISLQRHLQQLSSVGLCRGLAS